MTQCQGFGSANAQPVHHVLLLLLAMLTALPAGAVLPENNIDKTLVSLSADMAALMRTMPADLRRVDSRLQELHATTDELERTLEETAVMLLSQDERYLYGTLQATQGMKDVVRRIRAGRASLRAQERDLVTITARYAALARLLRPGGVGADSVRVSTAAGRRALAANAGRADTLRRALGAPLSAMRSERARYARL